MAVKKRIFAALFIIGVLTIASLGISSLYSFSKTQYEHQIITQRINSYLKQGDYQKTVNYAEGLIKVDPNDPYLYSQMGFALIIKC